MFICETSERFAKHMDTVSGRVSSGVTHHNATFFFYRYNCHLQCMLRSAILLFAWSIHEWVFVGLEWFRSIRQLSYKIRISFVTGESGRLFCRTALRPKVKAKHVAKEEYLSFVVGRIPLKCIVTQGHPLLLFLNSKYNYLVFVWSALEKNHTPSCRIGGVTKVCSAKTWEKRPFDNILAS